VLKYTIPVTPVGSIVRKGRINPVATVDASILLALITTFPRSPPTPTPEVNVILPGTPVAVFPVVRFIVPVSWVPPPVPVAGPVVKFISPD